MSAEFAHAGIHLSSCLRESGNGALVCVRVPALQAQHPQPEDNHQGQEGLAGKRPGRRRLPGADSYHMPGISELFCSGAVKG